MTCEILDNTKGMVLIVDDLPANLDLLYQTLAPAGHTILAANNGEAALKIAAQTPPDLVLLDVMMPGLDGYETCRRMKAANADRNVPVIFITAANDTASMINGFQAGGVDYITKPFQADEVIARVHTHLKVSLLTKELAARNSELSATNSRLQSEIVARQTAEASLAEADTKLSLISDQEAERWGLAGFVGGSPAFSRAIDDLRRLQDFPKASVLILGESGTGKELIARSLHFGSPRKSHPFIPVNCAAIPAELAEAKLFGHTRGAFTGAIRDQKGCFELAHGGTLFLDEVGDMPHALQSKLLRVLEDGIITPVGGAQERKVDVRVIAATNVNLSAKIEAGQFRQDLFFRLARTTINLPPLRERLDDIPLLASHFVKVLSNEMGRQPPSVAAETVSSLKKHSWPGNVRELKNILESAIMLCGGREIRPEHIRVIIPSIQSSTAVTLGKITTLSEPTPGALPWNLDEIELEWMRRALEETSGNVVRAAKLLGVDRSRIYRRFPRTSDSSPQSEAT